MAEFCLECWNKLNETNDPAKKYVISKELDLCESCGEWKNVIIAERRDYYLYKLRFVLFPFVVLGKLLYFFWRILLLPYLIYKKLKEERN